MMGPRTKLTLVAAVFALPVVASLAVYHFARPEPTANYGELLLPPATITTRALADPSGARFTFAQLEGKWILVASDSGACAAGCVAKLTALRQVRLALGREALRVERVFVVDDQLRPDAEALKEFAGTVVALNASGAALPPGAANDRDHIYLVDPHGNVMMRWPAGADRKRLLGDLQRLLKASQIG
jgi:cytochrome oxidase Cu insertion factor (SCO1/SenC/PrrC family)